MRKTTDNTKREIHKLRRQGYSQAKIAKFVGVSIATVSNVLSSPDPSGASEPAPSVPSTPAGIPDEVPEGAAPDLVARWIDSLDRMARAADAAKDYGAVSSLMAKLTALLEHQRKATPAPLPDPNDNPDMIALGEIVWQKFRKAFAIPE